MLILNVDDNLFIVHGLEHGFWCFLTSFCILVVKVTGKLQDGTVIFKKGHDNEGELFEFKTDEGNSKNVSMILCFIPGYSLC